MSFAFALNPTERLARVLKENKGKFDVNKDGYISVDLNNSDVLTEINKQLEKLEALEQKIELLEKKHAQGR